MMIRRYKFAIQKISLNRDGRSKGELEKKR